MTIPLKQWCAEEVMREKTTAHAIYIRLRRGHYPHVPLERKNQRVVLVNLEAINDWMGLGAYTEGK